MSPTLFLPFLCSLSLGILVVSFPSLGSPTLTVLSPFSVLEHFWIRFKCKMFIWGKQTNPPKRKKKGKLSLYYGLPLIKIMNNKYVKNYFNYFLCSLWNMVSKVSICLQLIFSWSKVSLQILDFCFITLLEVSNHNSCYTWAMSLYMYKYPWHTNRK